jgi:Leucine-rich repeat (LRR) protein
MLRAINIKDCVQLTCLQGLNYLTSLRNLTIVKCPNLIMALEEAEKVQQCLDGITVDDIPMVPQLVSRKGFSSLRMLCIEESDEPREEEILQQVPSLTSLHIDWCKWSSLPENLGNLPQLQRLFLRRCPNIRSLPTLPVSLRSFTLCDCGESFMKSCQTAGDPNWQKIAHVRTKEFIQHD